MSIGLDNQEAVHSFKKYLPSISSVPGTLRRGEYSSDGGPAPAYILAGEAGDGSTSNQVT